MMMARCWQLGVPEVPEIRALLGDEGGGGDRGCSHANVALTIVPGASTPREAEAGTKH